MFFKSWRYFTSVGLLRDLIQWIVLAVSPIGTTTPTPSPGTSTTTTTTTPTPSTPTSVVTHATATGVSALSSIIPIVGAVFLVIIIAAVVAMVLRGRLVGGRGGGGIIAFIYDISSDSVYITRNVQTIEQKTALVVLSNNELALVRLSSDALKPVKNSKGLSVFFAEVSPFIGGSTISNVPVKMFQGKTMSPMRLAELGSVELVLKNARDGGFTQEDAVNLLRSIAKYTQSRSLKYEHAIPLTKDIYLGISVDFGRLLSTLVADFKDFSNAYIMNVAQLDRILRSFSQVLRYSTIGTTVKWGSVLRIIIFVGAIIMMIVLFYFLFISHII